MAHLVRLFTLLSTVILHSYIKSPEGNSLIACLEKLLFSMIYFFSFSPSKRATFFKLVQLYCRFWDTSDPSAGIRFGPDDIPIERLRFYDAHVKNLIESTASP